MDSKILLRLVDEAREDPKFFHTLVFDPEKVLDKLDYLDEAAKQSVRYTDPGALLATLVGELGCDGSSTCSCTSGTCDGTCGGSTCSVTCSGDSCGRTCDNSCGYTTNFIDPERWRVLDPFVRGVGSAIGNCEESCGRTSCGETVAFQVEGPEDLGLAGLR